MRGLDSYRAEVGKATHGPSSPAVPPTPDVGRFTCACGYQLLKTELDYSVRIILKSAFINQPIFVATHLVPGAVLGAQKGR